MNCRPDCAACCIAPSISSPIPALQGEKAPRQTPGITSGISPGKAAGARCPQLDASLRCRLFGLAQRPAVCGRLQASLEMCGSATGAAGQAYALRWLAQLEEATAPAKAWSRPDATNAP